MMKFSNKLLVKIKPSVVLLTLFYLLLVPSAYSQISGLPSTMCEGDAPITLSGNPSGGVFSGPGISGSVFDPGNANIGSNTISYDPLNYSVSSISYAGISGGGTTISLSDDQVSGNLNIGFNFRFYGTNYTTVKVSSNGFLGFGTQTNAGCCSGQTLPNTATPNNIFAFLWEDLDPGNGDQGAGNNKVWYTTTGTAPFRQFRMTFWRVDHYSVGNNVTVRAILYESSNRLEVHIARFPGDGGNHTIGVENISGTRASAIAGLNGSPYSGTLINRAYRFTPRPPSTATVSVTPHSTGFSSCNSNMTVSTDAGNCSANVTYSTPTVNDNCATNPTPSQSSGLGSGANFPLGATNNVYTYTDASGTSVDCSFNVTVADNEAPVAVCQNITVQLDASGLVSITPSDINGASTDNCGLAGFGVTQSSFGCSDVGGATTTLEVTDNSGNTATCVSNITVEDNVNPVAVCQDVTVQLDSAGNGTLSGASMNNGSSDACGIGSLSPSQTAFTCSDLGANTISLFVSDNNGNSDACNATVTVEDNSPPVATCQNLTLQLDGAGNASLLASDIDNGSTDACGLAGIAASQQAFDCNDVGNVNVILTVTDNFGNASNCNSTVTIEDNTAPIAICQPTTVFLDASGNGALVPSSMDNGSSDVCGIASFSASQTTFNCSDLGANSINLTASDPSGNTGLCAAIVIVIDSTNPVAICQDITVYLDQVGTATLTASDLNGSSSDACGIAAFFASPTGFNCSNISTQNTSTLSMADSSGNQNSCTSNVAVLDTIAPVAICADISISLNGNGEGVIVPADIDNGSFDVCGFQGSTLSQDTFYCTSGGSQNVILTVLDVFGNSDTCSANVTLNDFINPVIDVCPSTQVVNTDPGQCTANLTGLQIQASDNCFISSITNTFNGGSDASGMYPTGVTNVNVSVFDDSGNDASCSFSITVNDNESPVINCPTNIVTGTDSGMCGAVINWANPSMSDNCGILSTVSTSNSGSVFPVGQTTVIYMVTDSSSNGDTCSFQVTVSDNQSPVVICPPDTTINADTASCVATYFWAPPVTIENCLVDTLFSNIASGSNFPVGATTVTYSITDNSGNSGACSFVVTAIIPQLNVSLVSTSFGCGYSVNCSGDTVGEVAANISGGCSPYSLIWSTGDTTSSIDSLGAGNYSVTVTDGLGSTFTDNITLTEPNPISISYNSDSLVCFGEATGSINLNVIGGFDCNPYTYSWSNGDTSMNVNGLPVGSYTVLVTDVAGCTGTANMTMTSLPLPIIDLGADTTICNGDTIVVDAGTSYDGYAWSTGDSSSSTLVVNSGDVWVTVNDTFGCANTDTMNVGYFITDPELISPHPNPILCDNEVLVLTGDPGFVNYSWSTGAATQVISISGFGGPITLIVEDSAGCRAQDSIFVEYNNVPAPNPGITPGPDVNMCVGDMVALDLGTSYSTINWNTGDVSQSIVVTAPGQYWVDVTNGVGCAATSDTVTVTEIPSPNPVVTKVGDSLVSSGSYFTYQWFQGGAMIPSATQFFHMPQIDGWYIVSVTDSNGCEGSSDSVFCQAPVAVDNAFEKLTGIDLYPNPTSGIIHIRSKNPIDWNVSIEVLDMYGHSIKQMQLTHLKEEVDLDLSQVANGFYLLKIVDEKGRTSLIRFMVE